MAKKKSKRRKTAPATGISRPGPKAGGPLTVKRLIVAGLVAAAGAAGWFFWQSSQADRSFMQLAADGQAGLAAVKTHTDLGGGHFSPGESQPYSDPFPTSGRHHPQWASTGFHETPQFAAKLIHAMEHGNVVIYYDSPGAGTMETLKDWASLYVGQWSGVVVTPSAGLGKAIVLTAWRKSLRLNPFDPATAAAFIDTYRGRGPEHPVR